MSVRRVAFVNGHYQLGGAETVVHQLRRGVVKHGARAPLYVAIGKDYPRNDDVVPLYPRLLSRLAHSRFHGAVETLFPREDWVRRRFSRLGNENASVIHLHNLDARIATPQAIASLARRKPLIWTFHHYWGMTGGCQHPKECMRYLDSCGECPHVNDWPLNGVDDTSVVLRNKVEHLSAAPITIVAPSRYLADKVSNSRVGRSWRIHQIPNGVNTSRYGFQRKHDPVFRREMGLRTDRITLLSVNRNFKDPEKGFGFIRDALFKADLSNVQVVFVGLHSDWAASQLSGHCECLPVPYQSSAERLAAWFEGSDILLFASPAEVFPCTIIEAMSAKCCVVATPTIGVVEQIEHQISGLLADDISGAALGSALQLALQSPEKLREFGEAARRRVEAEFSEEVMVRRHLDLYASLASSRDASNGAHA